MSCVFSADREVDWPVKISVPADGGATDEHEITARLKLASGDEFTQIRAAVVQSMFRAGQGEGSAPSQTERDRLAKYVIDWDGIETEDGEPIPCNDETRLALLDIPYLYTAFSAALMQASSGARAKN
jgi:hypothetical protein